MPIYDYKCPKCDLEKEMITKHNYYPRCPGCKATMKRQLHSKFGINMGAAGAHGYYDENLDTYVETNRHRRELMRQQGVTEKGGSPKIQGDAWV